MAQAALEYPLISTTRRPGRSLSMRVLPDGTLKINAPVYVSDRRIRRFISSRSDWIKRQQNQFDSLYDFAPNTQVASGLTIRIEAGSHLEAAEFDYGVITIKKPADSSNWQAYQTARPFIKQRLNALAASVLESELSIMAAKHGHKYSSLTVKFLRSRWGSCTSRGNIALNSQLLRLPIELRQYVLAHELAHLKAADHSPKFYKELENLMPDALDRRRKLKDFRLLH